MTRCRARCRQAALIGVLLVPLLNRAHLLLAADAHEVLADFTLTSWSKKDGITGSIWSVAQDADGYLWLGTDGGLLRFDGIRFVAWEALGGPALLRAPIQTMCASSDGNLWLGLSDNGGIVRLHGRQLQRYGAAEGLPASTVLSIVEDRAKTLWAATSSGLFRFAAGKWLEVGVSDGLPAGQVSTVYADSSGTLWVATGSGLFWQPGATEANFQPIDPASTDIRGLSEDATGRIWATDPSSGFRTIGPTLPAEGGAETGRGVRVLHDRKGDLWVATLGQGLWRVRPPAPGSRARTRTIDRTTVTSGLSSDAVHALFEDRDGNIWTGTSEGLDRLTPHRVVPITGLGVVSAVDVTRDGQVFVGTGEEILRFSQVDGEWQRDASRWPLTDIRALRVDAAGAVWAATNAGLFRLVGDRLGRVPLPANQAPTVDALAPDARGGLWMIRDHEILRWEAGRADVYDRLPDAAGRATSAYVDRSNQVWIAFADSRLGVLRGRGQFTAYGPQDGLATGPYHMFHEGRDGTMWVAGGEGLSRFTDGRFSSATRANGLPDGGVFAIEDDQEGALWLGTSSGLVRFEQSEFDGVARKADGQLRFRVFDLSDGVAGFPGALGDRNAARATDGTLWFVTSRGLTVVDPRLVSSTRRAIRAEVDDLVVNEGRAALAASNAVLPAGTSRLLIGYTAPNLTFPLKTAFRYRLDGFDAGWINAGTNRQALYTNLPPRQYTFHVVVNDDDDRWLESEAVWAFTIRPMFYQTAWFGGLMLGAIAALLWGAWEMRVRQLRRQFALVLAERVRLSQELHDTLLQSLVGVALQFDAVSKNVDASPTAAKAHVVRMREQVEEYIREARRSIWALRSPALDTGDLSEALRQAGERATADHPVRFEFSLSGTASPYPADTAHQLLRIGQEAVLNAVRHARARAIRMELVYGPDAIVLRVSDDGAGFDTTATRDNGDHYGLTTMRERAQRVGGTLTITSSLQTGTLIEAVVPDASHAAVAQR